MRIGRGLAFVWRESCAFLARGWWLALLAGIPFTLSDMVRWNLAAAEIAPYLAASSLSALLDTGLFLVVIRFVTGAHDLRQALRVDGATLRRFAPYALFTIAYGVAQYYVYLTDDTLGTYLLASAVGSLLGALLAPWAVTSATGALKCGPRNSIRMVAPHIVWSMAIFALLFAVQFAGQELLGLVPPMLPAFTLGGVTFADVGYDLRFLVFGSIFVVVDQVAVIAVAMRAGVTPDGHRGLRDTFS
jgi:hypothetical protein